ncbi:MAG: DUF4329 domain-containing protein [Rhodobacteraceae bacterium]|nr:DUF4329 domain-containing protein [Paracoccaceae bacterium]
MFRRLFPLVALLLFVKCVDGYLEPEPINRIQPQSAAEIAFTKAFFSTIQEISFADNREYCGYIGLNAEGGFAATPAKRGKRNYCVPRYAPRDFRVLASYHTHGAASLAFDTEVPSFDDLRADIYEGIDGYIATPGGRVWYDDAAKQRSVLLCGVKCVTADPDYTDNKYLPVGTMLDLDAL